VRRDLMGQRFKKFKPVNRFSGAAFKTFKPFNRCAQFKSLERVGSNGSSSPGASRRFHQPVWDT
jgi:hypothetical protein